MNLVVFTITFSIFSAELWSGGGWGGLSLFHGIVSLCDIIYGNYII